MEKPSTKLTQFITDILTMPIWIKQTLYVYLKYKLEEEITDAYLNNVAIEDIFQLHKAELTYNGKKEFEQRTLKLDEKCYTFMQDSINGLTIVEIAVKNYWKLQEMAEIFTNCLDKELIKKTASEKIIEMVRYISGETRLGEYFVRTGRISIEQLQEVLTQQEKIEKATGEKVGVATILVNLEYIREEEVKALIRFKEESRRRFILKSSKYTSEEIEGETESELMRIKLLNERILKENKILKDQLRKILNLPKS
ncbi:MAG: hypothetical protein PHX18_08310 [Candidatus Gastranaerophilales bacterium]|nr:hypothetical protein [Candidatus Gastranaerophilales bacterium]